MKKAIFVLTAGLFASSVFAQSLSAPAASSDRSVDPDRVNRNRMSMSEPAATSVPGGVIIQQDPNNPNTVGRSHAPQTNPQQPPAQNQINNQPGQTNPSTIQTNPGGTPNPNSVIIQKPTRQ